MKIKKKKVEKFYDVLRDGVTQSLLTTFLVCRQKCDISCKGWSTKGVKPGMTFGTISHGCLEHAYNDLIQGKLTKPPVRKKVVSYLEKVEQQWRKENPRAGRSGLEVLESSLAFAEAVLPEYFKYWKNDFSKFKWESLEGTFRLDYTIQNGPYKGVTVPVRGKKDGQFSYKGQKGLWLFETKNKSRIDENSLLRILPFELQVQLYLWALMTESGRTPKGTLYNVIRRPGLRQGAKESLVQFARRCAEDVVKRPEWYFMRFEIAIGRSDIDEWLKEFDGLVSDFYAWAIGDLVTYKNTWSCENKYGTCECLSICSEGNYSNFEKRKTMFRELEDM